MHLLPVLQAVPLGAFGLEQVPVVGSQMPARWHWSDAVQTTGLLPVQTPFWHVFVWKHLSVPVQAVPLGAFGLEHRPVVGSHVPAWWHWSMAAQTTGLLPVQTPP